MAEEKTEKPARKSRREALYDSETSVKAREGAAKEKAPGGVDRKMPEAAPAAGRAEMLRRHENERRDIHGRHREEHRTIDAEPDAHLMHKKMAAHRRHEQERSDMHSRHEQELTAVMNETGEAPQPAQAA